MKKYTFLLFLMLLFGISVTKAQTVQIENAVKAPGDIAIEVEMLGFTGSNGSVQSIQFQIAFDDNLLYFKGISDINASFPGWVVPSNGSSSPITLSYISMAGHDINTKVFDLLFGYSGGFSGTISFIPSGCEITRGGLMTMNNVTYTNGSVSQTTAVATANFGNTQQAAVSSSLNIPVNMQGSGLLPFSALTYRIGYDSTQLTYVQLNNSILGGTLVGSATGGVLTVTWNGTINSLPGAHVFDIMFIYNGGGDASLDFLPGSQISAPSLAIIPTNYTGMTVQSLPGSSTISMPAANVALNASVSVPISLDYSGTGYIGGVNLKIGYSTSMLTFNGITTGTLGAGITASATGGEITIVWNNPANTANLDGAILSLNFTSASTAGSSLLTFNAGTTVTQTNLSNVILSYTNGSVTVGTAGSGYSISGILSYMNSASTPLTNTTVLLKQFGVIVQQTTTNGSGYFLFDSLTIGVYTLDAICTKPWGGVNANDALLVLKQFTGSIHLSPLKALAADVNASNYVNTADALIIAKRFVGLISSFPAGDWLFEHPVVTLTTPGNITQNFKGICFGDVDGSYQPQMKKGLQVRIEKGNDLQISRGEIIDIPLICTSDLEIGSISLRLEYPAQSLDILEVVSPGNDGNLVYYQENGLLNIAWYSLTAKQINAGDVILHIKARILQRNHEAVSFTVLPGSEFGSPEADIIDNVKFAIPSLIAKNTEDKLLDIYPNPFINNTLITYTLPESGRASLVVCNFLGEEIYTLQDMNLPEGKYQFEWIPGNLANGTYFCKLNFKGKSTSKSDVRLVIIAK